MLHPGSKHGPVAQDADVLSTVPIGRCTVETSPDSAYWKRQDQIFNMYVKSKLFFDWFSLLVSSCCPFRFHVTKEFSEIAIDLVLHVSRCPNAHHVFIM